MEPIEVSITGDVPGLANVHNVDTILTGLPQVLLHVSLQVLAAEVALSRQEHLDVLGGGIEGGGEVGGSHDGRLLAFLFFPERRVKLAVRGEGKEREEKVGGVGKVHERLHRLARVQHTHVVGSVVVLLPEWDNFMDTQKSVRKEPWLTLKPNRG